MDITAQHVCFGGRQMFCKHASRETGTEMTFSVFVPPQAATTGAMVPVVTWLSGLTCTEKNFTEKAGAQRLAAELGLLVVAPDTSPRGLDLPGEHDSYDFGSGAGFYLDATRAPWADNYRMYSYITRELPEVIADGFPMADMTRQSVMGHSMGGHGALTIALKNPDTFKAVSAFAPIVAPTRVPWGQKAFTGYLGDDRAAWAAYDACQLIADGHRVPEILVDQGMADSFLEEQLKPDLLEDACGQAGIALTLRRHPGYDHSYYFMASFIADHLRWHADRLGA